MIGHVDDMPEYGPLLAAIPQGCADLYEAWTVERAGPGFWFVLDRLSNLDPDPHQATGFATLIGNLVALSAGWITATAAEAGMPVAVTLVPGADDPPLVGQVAALIANALDGDHEGVAATLDAIAVDDLMPTLYGVLDVTTNAATALSAATTTDD